MKRGLKESEADVKQTDRKEYSDQKEYSLEENFVRLEQVIGDLEKEDITLEEAFSAYSRGMAILKACNEQIDSVEKRVLKLTEEGALQELEEMGE